MKTDRERVEEMIDELISGDSSAKRAFGRLLASEVPTHTLTWFGNELYRAKGVAGDRAHAVVDVLLMYIASMIAMHVHVDGPEGAEVISEDVGEILRGHLRHIWMTQRSWEKVH